MSSMAPSPSFTTTGTAPATPIPFTLRDAILLHNQVTRPWELVVAEFFDSFYMTGAPILRKAMLADEPPMPVLWQTDRPDQTWHVYLGGIAEWLAHRAGIAPPEWVFNADRYNPAPVYPYSAQPLPEDRKQRLRESSLPELAARNDFVNSRLHERGCRWIDGFDTKPPSYRPGKGRPVLRYLPSLPLVRRLLPRIKPRVA